MLHLPADRLAELVDTEPTPQELAHLQSCTACSRERSAFRALREVAAAARDCTVDPLLSWDDLRPALAAEGLLVRTAERPAILPIATRSRFTVRHWSVRIAASIALLAGGVAVGRVTAPEAEAVQTARSEPPANPPSTGQEGASFTTATEAMTALVRAQQEYQRAAAFLLASDTTIGPTSPTMYRQRLAALDELMGVTRSALTRSPQDPVINSYYLAALGAREATLQQLELALPEGTRIDRF